MNIYWGDYDCCWDDYPEISWKNCYITPKMGLLAQLAIMPNH